VVSTAPRHIPDSKLPNREVSPQAALGRGLFGQSRWTDIGRNISVSAAGISTINPLQDWTSWPRQCRGLGREHEDSPTHKQGGRRNAALGWSIQHRSTWRAPTKLPGFAATPRAAWGRMPAILGQVHAGFSSHVGSPACVLADDVWAGARRGCYRRAQRYRALAAGTGGRRVFATAPIDKPVFIIVEHELAGRQAPGIKAVTWLAWNPRGHGA